MWRRETMACGGDEEEEKEEESGEKVGIFKKRER